MPRKGINQSHPKDFEPKKKNPISLGDDSNIDNDLKPLLIGGERTSIEISNQEVRVVGELDVDSISSETITTSKINQDSNYGILEFTTFDMPVFRFDAYSHTFSIISQFGVEPGYDLFSIDLDEYGSAYLETFDGADDDGKQAKMVFKSCSYISIYANKNGAYTDSANYVGFGTGDSSTTHGRIDMNTASNFGIHSSTNYNLELKSQGTGDIELNADGGQVTIKDDTATHFLFDCDATMFRIYDDANANDFFTITVGAEGATTISTLDADTTAAHLTLDADGNTIISINDGNESGGAFHVTPEGATNRAFSMWGEVDNTTTFLMYEMGGASTSDYFKMETSEHGATTISTVDGASDNADLTIAPDGKLLISSNTYLTAGRRFFFDGASGHSYISEDSADLLNFQVGGVNLMAIAEDATTSAAQSSKIYTGCPIYLRDIGGVSDTPPSNYGSLYVNSDVLYFKTDGGTVTNLLSGGGGSSSLNSIVAAMVFG